MSESKGQQGQQSQQKGQQSNSPLQSERGSTSIQNAVVSKVSGIAAQEVEGIRMGGGGSQAVSGLIGSITGNQGGGQTTTGVTVEVGQEEAAIDLILTAEYGKSIPQLSEAVRRNVINRVENLVGLKVNEVNIDVTNIFFPDDQNQQQLEQGQQQQSS
jgi:uncharacterized alkaline shock family protein YloU